MTGNAQLKYLHVIHHIDLMDYSDSIQIICDCFIGEICSVMEDKAKIQRVINVVAGNQYIH